MLPSPLCDFVAPFHFRLSLLNFVVGLITFVASARGLDEPLFPAVNSDGAGYIDAAGKVIIAMKFSGTRPFSENLAPVELGGNWGYLKPDGEFAIVPQFDDAGPFMDGLAPIQRGDVLN